MNSTDASAREDLFWELAGQLLTEPGVTRSTMMRSQYLVLKTRLCRSRCSPGYQWLFR